MNYQRGKVHKRGPEQGYDTTMCNRFAAPIHYSRGISNNWKDVDCGQCLRAMKNENKLKDAIDWGSTK